MPYLDTGNWEGDLILGSNNTAIATVVERHSRFTLLCKLEDRKTASVVDALLAQMAELPTHLLKSLTWDRGAEMAGHKTFTMATNMVVYFCDPSSPWQRGTNENTNGLLRQYFPKGKGMSFYSQAQLDGIANKLNTSPGKRWTLSLRQKYSVRCCADPLNPRRSKVEFPLNGGST